MAVDDADLREAVHVGFVEKLVGGVGGFVGRASDEVQFRLGSSFDGAGDLGAAARPSVETRAATRVGFVGGAFEQFEVGDLFFEAERADEDFGFAVFQTFDDAGRAERRRDERGRRLNISRDRAGSNDTKHKGRTRRHFLRSPVTDDADAARCRFAGRGSRGGACSCL